VNTELFVIDVERLVVNPDDIRVVQAQVGKLLEAVETRAPEVACDLAPRTAEQAALLEQGLKAALEKVKQIKKKLGPKQASVRRKRHTVYPAAASVKSAYDITRLSIK